MLRGTPAVVILIAVAVVAAVGARTALQETHHRLVLWSRYGAGTVAEPIEPGHPLPGATAQGSSPRVVLMLVDGLSAGDAWRLPMLEYLARSGVSMSISVPEPAWPVSAWATALTGLPPAGHGFVLPAAPPPLNPPHLPSVLQAAHLSVAAAGSDRFLDLIRPFLESRAFVIPTGWEGTGADLLAATRAALGSGADLVIVHLEGLHTLAHRLAGRDRTARVPWEDGLGWTDARVAQIVEGLNLEQTTLVLAGTYEVTADGAHGAGRPVPLIVAGPGANGIRPGPADLRAVGPTVAALLGQEWPTATALTAAPPRGLAAHLERWWENSREELPWAAGIMLTLVLYIFVLSRRPQAGPMWAAIGLYLIIWNGLFWLGGNRFSPELPGLEALDTTFWNDRVVEVLTAMAPAMVLLGWQLGFRRPLRPVQAAQAALHTTLVLMVLLALQALALALVTGWDPVIRWPGGAWVIKYALDLGQALILGLTSPLWAVVAFLTAAVGRAAREPEAPPPAPLRRHPLAGEAVKPKPGSAGAVIPIEPRRRR